MAKKTENSVDTSRACSNRKDKYTHSKLTTTADKYMSWIWIERGIITVVKILDISLGIVEIRR